MLISREENIVTSLKHGFFNPILCSEDIRWLGTLPDSEGKVSLYANILCPLSCPQSARRTLTTCSVSASHPSEA
jgi:hypothetical protein